MNTSIVLCNNINKLTYLLTYLLTASWLICRLTGCTFIVRMLYRDVHIDFYLATFYLNIPEVIGYPIEPGS